MILLLFLFLLALKQSLSLHSSIAAGFNSTCAITITKQAKCWGLNDKGQLGQGHRRDVGAGVNQMGENLPPVNLGSGRTVVSIVNGNAYACALLDNGRVKCWGTPYRFTLLNGTNDMGDSLPTIDFGTGRTAIEISAGGGTNTFACALLDNGQVKCWGYNSYGGLGRNSITKLSIDQLGDSLPFIDLGTGRTAVAISCGSGHACALLDNGQVKCWGGGYFGQLGQGNSNNIGFGPNQMGDNLPPINLGAGHSAMSIACGDDHTCAILDNGQVKCWGDNDNGQLGQGHVSPIGRSPNEMGDNLLPVNLGSGRTATSISCGFGFGCSHTCAILDNGQLKCWGCNFFYSPYTGSLNGGGALGQGKNVTMIGGAVNETGDNLPPVNLGTGRTAREVSTGHRFTCVRLDNDAVKCFGLNPSGKLGQGHVSPIGDGPNEMGDNLPVIQVNDCLTMKCDDRATCLERHPVADKTCKCLPGNLYDTIILRDLLSRSDFDAKGQATRQCHPVDVSLRVSNTAVEFRVNTSPNLNTTVAIGLTNGHLNSLLFGPSFPIPNEGIILGNKTQLVSLQDKGKYTYNGQEFYIIVKSVSNNATIVSERFILPCGCNATDLMAYPPIYPRSDDGRPIPLQIVQRRGKIYASWTDNSNCATQFGLHRVAVDPAMTPLFSSLQDSHDPRSYAFSDMVHSLVESANLTSVSVVSDFVLDSTTCFKKFIPIQYLDDVVQSRLAVGGKFYYCMTASNPMFRYSSAYACLKELVVQWEASFRVRITAGRTSLPSASVNATWEARIPTNGSTDEGIVFAKGSAIADRDGSLTIYVSGDPLGFPELKALDRLPVALWFAKESQVSTTESIRHNFLCDQGMRRCSYEDPQIVELALFSFDETPTIVLDATVVPFRGTIMLNDSQTDNFLGGCPVSGVEVCLRAPPADNLAFSYGCTLTNAAGKYELAAPIGSVVMPVASYQEHSFVRSGTFANQSVFKTRTQAIDNVDFKDVTKETLFIDIAGGLCNISIASALTVTLTKNSELSCSGWHRHYALSQMSPTRFSTLVPASYYEIAIPSTSVSSNDVPIHGGVTALAQVSQDAVSELISDFLSLTSPQPLNLTNVRGRGAYTAGSNANSSNNLTFDEFMSLRIVRFQYDAPTSMNMVLTQDDVVVGQPTSCSDVTQVVHADYNQPVLFSINFTQEFATGAKCSYLTGVAKVKAATSMEPASKYVDYQLVQVSNGSTNLTSYSTVKFLAFVQPNPVNSEVKPYTRFVEVGYRSGDHAPTDPFLVTLIVVGHYMNDDSKSNSVPIVFDPIAIVRDPPGDASYATYTNVESAVTYTSNQYDLFMGMVSDSSLTLGSDFEMSVCAIVGFGSCTKMAKVRNKFGLSASSLDLATERITRTKTSFTRHVTWSFQTPGPIIGADPKGQTPPGPMSDMFLVPIEIVFFIETYNVTQADECSATKMGPFITFTLPQNNSGGIGWYSRHDIINRIIPNLRMLLLQSKTLKEFTTLAGAFTKWSSMIEESPNTLSVNDYFLLEVLNGILGIINPIDVFGKVSDAARPWADFDTEISETETESGRRRVLSHREALSLSSLSRRLAYDCNRQPSTVVIDPPPVQNIHPATLPILNNIDENMQLAYSALENAWGPTRDALIAACEKVVLMRHHFFLDNDLSENTKFLMTEKVSVQLRVLAADLETGSLQQSDLLLDLVTNLQIKLHWFVDVDALDSDIFFLARNEAIAEVDRILLDLVFLRNARLRRLYELNENDQHEHHFSSRRKSDRKLDACPIIQKTKEKFEAQLEAKQAASAAEAAKIPRVQPLSILRKAGARLAGGAIPFIGIQLDVAFTVAGALDADHNSKESEAEPMPKWDSFKSVFLKDPFRPLPSKPSLWSSQADWTAEQGKAATSNVISFSGGGAQVKVEISDAFTGEKGMTVNQVVRGSLALNMDSSITVGAFNIEDNGKIGFEYSGISSFINASVTTKITSASFVLADSDAGDYFDVQVTRDLRYGTFAFNTTSGASKCPVESHTYSRENPVISSRPGDSTERFTHPALPAFVHLVIQHHPDYEPSTGTYELVADLKELKDSARVLVNGMPMDHPILFENLESSTSYPILLEVHRGAELYDVVFNLRLRSLCQTDLGEPYLIETHFAKPCPGIELAGPLSNGDITYILAGDVAHLQLKARRPFGSDLATTPWANLINVTSAEFTFKTHRGTTWTTVPVGDIRHLDALVTWDISTLPLETTLYVRAEVKCTVDGFDEQTNPELYHSVSSIATIVIDRVRPIVYEASPSLPVSTDVSGVEIAFSEVLRCENPFPFTAVVTFSGESAPGPLVLPSTNSAIIGRCAQNVISLALLYGLGVGKLRKVDVAGRRMVVTVEHVCDGQGNLAETNIPGQPFGVVQHTVQFLPVNPAHTWFKVSKLLVSGVDTSSASLAQQVLETLSNASMSINATRIQFTSIAIVEAPLNTVMVDLMVAPGNQVDEDVAGFFDGLTSENNEHSPFLFASGGGVDISYDDNDQRGSGGAGAILLQCEVPNNVSGDFAVMNTKVEGISSDLDGLRSAMAELKSLIISLSNSSNGEVTGASKEDSARTTASTTEIPTVAVVALTVMATLAGAGGVMLVLRMRQASNVANLAKSRGRRTGDFSVVGLPTSENLSVSAYNQHFSPHPVFGSEENA